jgi:hypothetical protein
VFDWDVFICHAGADKEAVARPLAQYLQEIGFRVWYDEFSLRIGDSLRRSIDKGLANTRFGIVILSPNFFKREWPQAELDGLFARQRAGSKVILPVWHQLSLADVRTQSPQLADLIAVRTDGGIAEAAKSLAEVMRLDYVSKESSVTVDLHRETQTVGDQSYQRRVKLLSTYAQNVVSDIHNNLVLELYDKSHYEDVCITPLIQALDSFGRFSEICDVTQLAQLHRSAIIGEPGSGKTTALRLLALDLLRRVPTQQIPVYLPLASFGRFDKEQQRRFTFSDYITRVQISCLAKSATLKTLEMPKL